ncbi:MAG: LTA synthase family protein [Lachnospiraceae bacterium]|nr:LTA synthase family protein [Lachnospiraceae bacterium]
MIFLDMIFANYDIAFLITITFFFLLSLSMYYVHEFRGTNVNLSDILSLNTAKEVAFGYEYKIKPIFVIAFLLIAFEYIKIIRVFVEFGIWTAPAYKNHDYYHYIVSYRLSRLVLSVVLFMILRYKISSNRYDYSLFAGENEGYLYNFFSSIPIFYKKEKSSDETHISLKVEDFDKISDNIDGIDRPHIIVIMDESFGIVQHKVKTNAEVTPYYDNLHDVTKGNLYVNTFGGGTANTEFEFLTGMSIGNYSYPVMPYNNFVKSDKYSLARYFKRLNYKTLAMHPYTATNYHRDEVYKRFGFDELLFYDDFTYKGTVRNFVSDEAFYKEVIYQYESRKDSDRLFMFGITMQNHSGYQNFDDMEIEAEVSGKEGKESLDSYLSLMKISDTALKTLIDYFENEKEHVIILFFGDHNASFGTEINKMVYGDSLNYECNDQYQTPLFIYDNKIKMDSFIEATSANFLSLELLDKAKLPYDEFHKELKKVYDKYNVYNYHKRKSRVDGTLSYIPYDDYMKIEAEYLERS